jgi:D-glycero-D-manno-heptose 1,7-bisphosphate phosphatase
MHKAAFLDRDGVINVDRGYVHRIEDFEFVPGTLQACRELARRGWLLVVATNQSGIGRGLYTAQDFRTVTDWMRSRFEEYQAPLAGVYYCPHHPTEALGGNRIQCDCRKPQPGMLLAAARDLSDAGRGRRCLIRTAARRRSSPRSSRARRSPCESRVCRGHSC